MKSIVSVLRLARARVRVRKRREPSAHDTGMEIWDLAVGAAAFPADFGGDAIAAKAKLDKAEDDEAKDQRPVDDADAIRINFGDDETQDQPLACGCNAP